MSATSHTPYVSQLAEEVHSPRITCLGTYVGGSDLIDGRCHAHPHGARGLVLGEEPLWRPRVIHEPHFPTFIVLGRRVYRLVAWCRRWWCRSLARNS